MRDRMGFEKPLSSFHLPAETQSIISASRSASIDRHIWTHIRSFISATVGVASDRSCRSDAPQRPVSFAPQNRTSHFVHGGPKSRHSPNEIEAVANKSSRGMLLNRSGQIRDRPHLVRIPDSIASRQVKTVSKTRRQPYPATRRTALHDGPNARSRRGGSGSSAGHFDALAVRVEDQLWMRAATKCGFWIGPASSGDADCHSHP